MAAHPQPMSDRAEGRGAVTWRSVAVGLAGAVFANAWPTYSGYVIDSTWADFGQISLAAFLPYLLFVWILNEAMRRLTPRLALSGPECLVAFMMTAVAGQMQGEGLVGYWLGVITAPRYFVSPENGWRHLILRYAPDWVLVSDEQSALRYFYEGLPPGRRMAWGVFAVPLLWWSTFFVSLYLLCCFVAVMLRRQWADHERLAYPLAHVPLMLADRSRRRGWLPDVAYQRLFWAGAAIPIGIFAWNLIAWFAPAMPAFPVMTHYATFPRLAFARGYPPIHFKVDFFVASFAFLTSTEILFSLWFFHLLTVLQVGIMNRLGASIGPADSWCSLDAATGWQRLGGFAVFVLWGLWMARRHLAGVARRAWTGQGGPDDGDELVSYRTAFFGTLLCLLFCVLWLERAGMGVGVAAAFMVVLLLGYVGVAKIAAMSGIIYLRGPVTPQSTVWHLFGTANLSPASMVGLGLTFAFHCDAKGWIMSPFVHACRLAKSRGMGGTRQRGLFAWIGVASLLGAATAVGLVLYLSVGTGAYHFGVATFEWSHIAIWTTVARRVAASSTDPVGPDWARLGFAGGGAALTAGLLYLRTRFAWWPLHPVGFLIASSYPICDVAFSVFLVWLVKVALFRLGGIRLYRRAIPLFAGMLCGYMVAVGAGFVVDWIWFPGAGHHFHGF